jgi:Protein of unknown function (DUF3047)
MKSVMKPPFLFPWLLLAMVCLGLSACATQSDRFARDRLEQTADEAGYSAEAWKPMNLPSKRNTQFISVAYEGRPAVKAVADRSASMFIHKRHIPAKELGKLKFSWKTDRLNELADMAVRDKEDAVVRIVLSFEGDRSKFSNKNRMLSELSLALTGEELPYATLMYVWCNKRELAEVIINPRTDRIRKLVVESGKQNLNKWLDYERDIRSDFIKAFGEEPGALTGIALMTDTDNTQTQATAWYGPVSFQPWAGAAATN